MTPPVSVSGTIRWCSRRGFYLEQECERRLRLIVPRLMRERADDLLYDHVSLHGWFEARDLFVVHSVAAVEG